MMDKIKIPDKLTEEEFQKLYKAFQKMRHRRISWSDRDLIEVFEGMHGYTGYRFDEEGYSLPPEKKITCVIDRSRLRDYTEAMTEEDNKMWEETQPYYEVYEAQFNKEE